MSSILIEIHERMRAKLLFDSYHNRKSWILSIDNSTIFSLILSIEFFKIAKKKKKNAKQNERKKNSYNNRITLRESRTTIFNVIDCEFSGLAAFFVSSFALGHKFCKHTHILIRIESWHRHVHTHTHYDALNTCTTYRSNQLNNRNVWGGGGISSGVRVKLIKPKMNRSDAVQMRWKRCAAVFGKIWIGTRI